MARSEGRCVICDYTEEDGSEIAGKLPSPRNRVSWDTTHNGFLCTECRTSIKHTISDYQFTDA